jgi:hypothetical protein
MRIEEKVEKEVADLLAIIVANDVDSTAYEYVLESLTRMAMLGTAPAGCRAAPDPLKKEPSSDLLQPFSREPGRRRHSAFDSDDEAQDGEDWSHAKENFIAR